MSEDIALNLLGGLIVTYCVVAAWFFWTHRRPVGWDEGLGRWRSASDIFHDRRWR